MTDLPPTLRGKHERSIPKHHRQIIAKLARRPGNWMKVATRDTKDQAAGLAASIRHGRYRAFEPAGKYEATIRGNDVWARLDG